MARIAFIGLGIMGAPMSANLAKAGHQVTGYNRSPGKAAGLVAAGGRAAESIAEAVADAEIIALMLPDSADVETVMGASQGVLDTAREGALVIDFSSINPDIARRVAGKARERGLRMLDAPVSGGEAGAIEGSLSIMVGGEQEDFETASSVFDAVGKTIVFVGPSGSGQTVKVANQLLVAGAIELLAEGIVFLEASGVETQAALRVLGGGLAGSTVLDRKGAAMLARDYRPGFRLELHDKDLNNFMEAARVAGVTTPLGAVVSQLVKSLKARGFGHLDHAALLMLVEMLSGREKFSPSSRQPSITPLPVSAREHRGA